MILYHGSNIFVAKPDIWHSRKNVDFGAGFYVTPLREQAESWCMKFLRSGDAGIVSSYDAPDELFSLCRALSFDAYTAEWLELVVNCRRGCEVTDYDVISGGVANDKVFNTCELYFRGLISQDEALGRLRFEKPNQQICFKTQQVINSYLRFTGSFSL